jgi:hypothetical protein
MKYVERLAVCIEKANDPHIGYEERERWKIAAQTYEHLIKCDKAHSLMELKGNKKLCLFFGRDGKYEPRSRDE